MEAFSRTPCVAAAALFSGEGTRRSVSIGIDQVDVADVQHFQTDGKGPRQGDSGGPALAAVARRRA